MTEKGATTRRLYLPRGRWYDFWTGEAVEGGREVDRAVDLATVPMYVRAGTILPMGPVRQFTSERPDAPLTLRVYSGADGRFRLYEDDGVSFAHRHGEWMGIDLRWDDRGHRLTLELADGSRMRPPLERRIEVERVAEKNTTTSTFAGTPLELKF